MKDPWKVCKCGYANIHCRCGKPELSESTEATGYIMEFIMKCPECGNDLTGDVVFVGIEVVTDIRCVDEDCPFHVDIINDFDEFERI